MQVLPYFWKFCHSMLRHQRRRMSSRDSSSSSSASSATSRKKSQEPRGRSKSKKKTASKYELFEKNKPKSSSTSESSKESPKKKTAPKSSSSAKKKIKEFFSKDGKFLMMKLLMVALFLVVPLTLLLCVATDPVQSDNTRLGFVVHLYINATSVLITLAAFVLKGLLLLPLYLAFFTINFLLWLFNCNETVVDQIVTTAATGPDLQV